MGELVTVKHLRGTQVEIVIPFQVNDNLASIQHILYTRPHVIKFTNSSINPQNNPFYIGLMSLRKIINRVPGWLSR